MNVKATFCFYNIIYMRFIFFISLIFSTLLSCKKEKDSSILTYSGDYKLKLNLSDSIKIRIDDSMAYRYISHQVIENDSTTILLIGDLNNNGFSMVDIDNEKLVKKISFEVTGPDGLGTSSGGRNFYYHNKDSIFIFNQRGKIIFLTDIDNSIKKRFNLNDFQQNEIGEIIVESRFMPTFNNGILSFCLYPVIPPYRNPNISNEPVYAEFNIENNTLKKGLFTYQNSHQTNKHPTYHYPSRVSNSSHYIFSNPFDNFFTLVDIKSGEILKKEFKSEYVKEYTPMLMILDKMREFDVTSTVNSTLLFNSQISQFYLIIELGIPFIDPNTGKQNQYEQKPFSVLVFDKDFNKLTEQRFEGGKYLVQNTFVGPKGLYLSKNNPLNPDFNENYYKYDVFTLEDN